jgi:hypothetical protein
LTQSGRRSAHVGKTCKRRAGLQVGRVGESVLWTAGASPEPVGRLLSVLTGDSEGTLTGHDKRLLLEEETMADTTTSGTRGFGLTVGGALVIAGIVIAIVWSLIIGIIVAVVGLVAFGGFVRGRWY